MSGPSKRREGLLGRLKSRKAPAFDPPARPSSEERSARRVKLPIPVRLKIGDGDVRALRLRDASLTGLFLEGTSSGKTGEAVSVRFDGYPEICEAFVLAGTIVRVEEGERPGLGIQIDRGSATPATISQYRKLVLHYIRHRALLADLDRGYFEGRCEQCEWIGHVGERNPRCAKCGGKVVPVTGGLPVHGTE